AAGQEVVTKGAGVSDDRSDLGDVDAKLLSRHHGERSTQASDVRGAGHQRQRSVLVELQRHGGLATDIEPEAGRDAATLVLAEWRLPVRAILGGFQPLDEADRAEFRTVGGLGAFLGRVLEAQLDGINAELL